MGTSFTLPRVTLHGTSHTGIPPPIRGVAKTVRAVAVGDGFAIESQTLSADQFYSKVGVELSATAVLAFAPLPTVSN